MFNTRYMYFYICLGIKYMYKFRKAVFAFSQTFIFYYFFCLSLFSACLLQETEPNYSKIVEYCEEVLLVSPVNAKAHHRKGVALYNLTKYEESMSSLLKADQTGK